MKVLLITLALLAASYADVSSMCKLEIKDLPLQLPVTKKQVLDTMKENRDILYFCNEYPDIVKEAELYNEYLRFKHTQMLKSIKYLPSLPPTDTYLCPRIADGLIKGSSFDTVDMRIIGDKAYNRNRVIEGVEVRRYMDGFILKYKNKLYDYTDCTVLVDPDKL